MLGDFVRRSARRALGLHDASWQPVPRRTMVARLNGATSIVRVWHPGDGRACGLCPADRCNLRDDLCAVMLPYIVPEGQAALHRRWDIPAFVSKPAPLPALEGL